MYNIVNRVIELNITQRANCFITPYFMDPPVKVPRIIDTTADTTATLVTLHSTYNKTTNHTFYLQTLQSSQTTILWHLPW